MSDPARSNTARICTQCEGVFELSAFNHRSPYVPLMDQLNLCFDCAFWHQLKTTAGPNDEVHQGKYYQYIAPKQHQNKPQSTTPTPALNSNGVAIDLAWYRCLGLTPDQSPAGFPDTCRTISKHTYRLIVNLQPFKCRAKGCWDRRECFWFDINIEKLNGSWNTIPASHAIGDEACVSFIDKSKLYE